MKVNQVFTIVNEVTKQFLGETAVLNEDLSNLVDVGKEVFDSSSVDNYVKALVDHIGKVVIVNRTYRGSAPSVLMDSWEYGAVVEKITIEMPEATKNDAWDLTDGQSYDPNVFYKPKVSVKFFKDRVTFQVPMSFTKDQVKGSFSSVDQMNQFLSGIVSAIEKSITVKLDGIIMATINNFIAATIKAEYAEADVKTKSTTKAVNLLYLYNKEKGTNLTADKALTDPDFIRYASYIMGLYTSRMSKISKLFNIGKKERFTPSDLLHVVMLADFQKSAEVYLYDGLGQFKNENIQLPKAETVPYWQGSGTNYDFNSVSSIDVKANLSDGTSSVVKASGILGVMFDRDALGVSNLRRYTESYFNPKARFYNNWYNADAGYFNDFNENFVVFFVA